MSTTRVVVHQPHFLPWPPYVARILACDVFVAQDSVQYRSRYYQNRTRLLDPSNRLRWMTVPVRATRHSMMAEVLVLPDPTWLRKLIRGLSERYSRSPYRSLVLGELAPALERQGLDLATYNLALLQSILRLLDVSGPRLVRLSALLPDSTDYDPLPRICKAVGANQYLFGTGGGKHRHPPGRLQIEGIEPIIARASEEFHEGLSIVHYLLESGPAATLQLLRRALMISPLDTLQPATD